MQFLLRNEAVQSRAPRFFAAAYLSRRPKVWLTSLEFGALTVLMLWVAILAKHVENRHIDFSSAQQDLQNFSLLFEDNVLRSLGELDKALLYLRKSVEPENDARNYDNLVRAADLLSDLIIQVAIMDEHGTMRASNAGPRPFPNIDLSDREHFKFHVGRTTDDLFISKPVVGRASGKMSVQLTRRFLKSDGSFGGVVVASFDPTHFEKLFGRVNLGPGAAYALIGADGVVRAIGGDHRDTLSLGARLPAAFALDRLDESITVTSWDATASQGTRDLVILRKVRGQPLAVSVRIPENTVYLDSSRNLQAMALIGLVLTSLILTAARRGLQYEVDARRRAEQLEATHEALRESHLQLVDLHSDLQRSEAEARRQHLLFEGVFESAPDGLVHVDAQNRIVNINPAFARLFDYSLDELRGRSLAGLFPTAAEYEAVVSYISGEPTGPISSALSGLRRNGEIFPVQLVGARILAQSGEEMGFLCVIRDVTLQQKRESALRQRQHLEALGRLTGGIAHDFNNLLTVISGNLQLVEMETNPARRDKYIAEAEHAVGMGARLNQRLIMFSRQRRLDPVSVEFDDLVSGVLDLIRRSIGEKIAVTVTLGSKPSTACIDASEMENALLNLALNARDAMEAGGTLSIETSNVTVGDGDSIAAPDLVPGEYIRLVVADTGSGMSKDVVARAFEPFFTTKPEGKGVGLGLTTIHGFIKQSRGFIALASEPGRGTTVTIHLPIASRHPAAKASRSAAAPTAVGRGQTILVVEDNRLVRNVTTERLKVLGYTVIEAASGAEALEIIGRGTAIDLVFSDIVMPGGVSGIELAKRTNRLRPDLEVLLTSGFPDETARLETVVGERLSVLQKPYSQEELARRIALALSSSAAAS